MSLVASFVEIVQPLNWAMSTPVFHRFLIVLTGWIFAPRRTVTGMLVAAGVAGQQHHAAFHRVFSKACWSLDQLGLIVFLLLKALLPEGTVKLSLDDTEAHKRGHKVYGVGMHHDPMLSTRKQPVLTWGHSWVILSVVAALPCCPGRVFSLPILFRLYLTMTRLRVRGARTAPTPSSLSRCSRCCARRTRSCTSTSSPTRPTPESLCSGTSRATATSRAGCR